MAKGMERFDCTIIGAGASGMMAAVAAARGGASVLLIEHGKKAGRKLLATGNGKCNFTNAYMSNSCYHGDDSLFPILERFTKEETISFFREIGVYPKEKRGYYYPNSEQAASVNRALEKELSRLHVRLLVETEVVNITYSDTGSKTDNCLENTSQPNRHHAASAARFLLETTHGNYASQTVVFATGLLASPKLGSDGSAFGLIKDFGHHFTTIVPALCGFYAAGLDWKKISGVRCDATIQVYIDGRTAASDTGELQLTDYGISGIPVFQVSRYASMALAKKQDVEASIRFLPELSAETLLEEFRFRCRRAGGRLEAYDLLDGLLNQKLIPVLLHRAGVAEHDIVTDESQHRTILDMLLDCRVTITKPRDFEFAQVCAGGIDTRDIDVKTLMSKHVPGLFFCGELLDVDGICGGYNLQWAWSSGHVAGTGAASFCNCSGPEQLHRFCNNKGKCV